MSEPPHAAIHLEGRLKEGKDPSMLSPTPLYFLYFMFNVHDGTQPETSTPLS
jgi:hypothetical protein